MRFWDVFLKTATVAVVALGMLYFVTSVMCGDANFTRWPEDARDAYGIFALAGISCAPVIIVSNL